MNEYIPEHVVMDAARKVAERVSGIEPDEVEDLAAAITQEYRPHINGYELTKVLDDNGDWPDPDADFVADMDQIDWKVNKAWQVWFQREGKAPLPVGTMIREGEITGVSACNVACYEVKKPGDPEADEPTNRRWIVSFDCAREV